tara:strand:- start:897 stop:1373 length:477 start_codon:yes stop_codon:yes gene_type:complete
MADFKFGSGAVKAAKRVTVTDAFIQNAIGPIVEVDQPAGTILDEVIVRFITGLTMGATASCGYRIGIASDGSGTTIGSHADGLLDEGTSVPANCVFSLKGGRSAAGFTSESSGDDAGPTAAAGYTDSDRKIYFTTISSDDAVSSNAKLELNFVFTHLN